MRACIAMMCVSIAIMVSSVSWWMTLQIKDYKPYPVCSSERKVK